MTSDHPEESADHPDDPDDRPTEDAASSTRPAPSPAETRGRTEYYIVLRAKVSAEQTTESRHTSAEEQGAAEKWQQDSAESRWIWQEYQRKWPSADRSKTDKPSGEANSSDGRTRLLDDATDSRVEAECDRIAGRERDKITPALRAIESQDPDRHLVGLDHRLKGRDRIKEKVDDRVNQFGMSPEEAVSDISDTIRFTFQYRDARYTEGFWSDIRRLKEHGFELDRIKNSWSGDQYKGINSQWIDPGVGQRFEVQFHTRISFEAKQLTHEAYEQLRAGSGDKLEQLVLEAFQSKVTGEVPVPPGATDIPDYP